MPWVVTFALSAVWLAIIVSQVFDPQAVGFRPIGTSSFCIMLVAILATLARPAGAGQMRRYDWHPGAAVLGICLCFVARTNDIMKRGWAFPAPPPVMVMVMVMVMGRGLVLLSPMAGRRCVGLPETRKGAE